MLRHAIQYHYLRNDCNLGSASGLTFFAIWSGFCLQYFLSPLCIYLTQKTHVLQFAVAQMVVDTEKFFKKSYQIAGPNPIKTIFRPARKHPWNPEGLPIKINV